MDVLVDYQGAWGLGDLLCSDPLMLGLVERYGADTRLFVRGKHGNVRHNPLVHGEATAGQSFDHVVAVRLFTHMPKDEFAALEAMPSLIDHMCSYGNVQPSDRRPQLWLTESERRRAEQLALPAGIRIAICADHLDPLRHWPVQRWQQVAEALQAAGAHVVEIGSSNRLGVGTDLVGRLSIRETAAVLERCHLFAGNNSGPFHYAQAAGTPCVTLFSLATPERFFHPGARVHPVQAEGLPCLGCMSRCFASMQKTGCIASPRGRCMTDIPIEAVLDAIERALASEQQGPPRQLDPPALSSGV
ncbi:MAG: glycosyltransferase family 9 protein [Planctomycetota bacterium]